MPASALKNSPELKALIEEALANNPQIKVARKKYEAARFRVPQASALPDPMFGTAYMGEMVETRLGPQEAMYEFEQEIPFPGKLIQKHKMVKAEMQLAEAQLRAAERDITAKVSQAYYDLFAYQQAAEIAEEMNRVVKDAEALVGANYASMRSVQADVAGARVSSAEVMEQWLMLQQQRDSVAEYLNALLNRQESQPWDALTEPDLPSLPPLEELLEKMDANPSILEATAMAKRERHAYALAKYENAPDFSIGFQYTQIGNGMTNDPDDGRDAWMIPIKVTLPLWQNRIGPGIKEARNNLQSSEAGLEDIRNMTIYELKNAYLEFVAQSRIATLYRDTTIPQTEMALHANQAGYESGQIDAFMFIESERTFLAARVAYYRALASALKSFSEIERLVGSNIHLHEVNHEEQ
jgi:outer membrane protein TolC